MYYEIKVKEEEVPYKLYGCTDTEDARRCMLRAHPDKEIESIIEKVEQHAP